MNKEQLHKERHYQITMKMVKNLLDEKVITREEYIKINEKMKDKYNPIISTLYADIDLI